MKHMWLLAIVLLVGCVTQKQAYTRTKRSWAFSPVPNNVITVVNNSGAVITLIVDGETIRENLNTSEVFTDEIYTSHGHAEITFTAIAHVDGKYVGSAVRVFPLYPYGRHAEVWVVNNVTIPGGF